jgi:hypothetical protein
MLDEGLLVAGRNCPCGLIDTNGLNVKRSKQTAKMYDFLKRCSLILGPSVCPLYFLITAVFFFTEVAWSKYLRTSGGTCLYCSVNGNGRTRSSLKLMWFLS